MSAFSEANVESIAAACRENIAALAESLQLNIGLERPIEVGKQQPFDAETVPEAFNAPGLAVVIEVDGQAILGLIPASLPLPDWYTAPDASEESRLKTIAMEWGVSLLPEEVAPGRTESFGVDNLRDSLIEAKPATGAIVLELTVAPPETPETGDDDAPESAESETAETETAETGTAESETAETEAAGDTTDDTADAAPAPTAASATTILLVLAVENPPHAPNPAETDNGKQPAAKASSGGLSPHMRAQFERLLPLPVTVSVRLAEKKIEMGNLLNLVPGMLVKFNKPCDDYLELYVNNFRYCRGEAIKIGEKFGLKIKDVGVVEEREERILNT